MTKLYFLLIIISFPSIILSQGCLPEGITFTTQSQIPQLIIDVYASRRTVGVEREIAYAEEWQYFKQGAYNQANEKSTKSEIYGGDIAKQYANGSYAEVWFKEASVGKSTAPNQ